MLIHIGTYAFRRGQRVRIKGITDKGDRDLNGRIGKLAPRFENILFGNIGCYILPTNTQEGGKCNLKLGEFDIIKKGSNANE